MMRRLLLILFSLVATVGLGQGVLLNEKVDTLIFEPYQSPKQLGMVQIMSGLNFGDASDGAKIESVQSPTFQIGYNRLFRVLNWWHIGGGFSYNRQQFEIDQDQSQLFGTGIQNPREYFRFNSGQANLMFRFNFTGKATYPGWHLDIGGFGRYIVGESYTFTDVVVLPNTFGGEELKTKVSKLNFIEPLQYGISGAIGKGKVALLFQHRLSNLFNDNLTAGGNSLPELPRMMLGVKLELY